MYDVVVKSSRSLSHFLMSSCSEVPLRRIGQQRQTFEPFKSFCFIHELISQKSVPSVVNVMEMSLKLKSIEFIALLLTQ